MLSKKDVVSVGLEVDKAINGKKKGETVEVVAPRGSMKFRILEIKAA